MSFASPPVVVSSVAAVVDASLSALDVDSSMPELVDPLVVRITHLGRTDLLDDHPRVTAWFERVQTLANFSPTYAFLQT